MGKKRRVDCWLGEGSKKNMVRFNNPARKE